jgi:hypothetical protein
MTIANFIAGAPQTLTRYGMGALVHDAGCRLVNKAVSLRILRGTIVRLQDITDESLFEVPAGYDARFAPLDDLRPYARAGLHDLCVPMLAQRETNGDRCYAIWKDGELAAYSFFSTPPSPVDDHFTFHYDPAWIYPNGGYTVPAYRGRRLHARGASQALRVFAQEGKQGLVSWVLSNNFASLRSSRRMGRRIFGTAYLLRAGQFCYVHADPNWAALGARFEARPLLSPSRNAA